MERFLITGGQGFFGAWIARRLLQEGAEFTLLDVRPDDGILAQVLEPDGVQRLRRTYGDIAEPGVVERAIGESGATHVIHLAALQVPACRADPALGARVNVLGAIHVFEAARRKRDQVRGVVYASSSAVAGPAEEYDGAIADEAAHRPRTLYGVFKAANEGSALVYWLDHGVPSVGLRPLSVYGVGREVGITSGPTKAVRAAVLGEPYVVPFTGKTSFNYVEDVAAVFIGCARTLREGALALNTPGEAATVGDFLRAVETVVPEGRGKLRAEGPPLPVAWDFAETGLRGLLGQVPHTPILEGVRRTAERFRALKARGLFR
jgi:nucleoside-diphosphate-sugar epimerase